MYIKYNSKEYPCRCNVGKTMVYMGLPDDFPVPVEGDVILCADDGFVLRADNCSDYLRQTFKNGILTLTNVPEPEPESIETIRAGKESEISTTCNETIVAGMDVETSVGTEHFSLQETDQINLTTATNAVQNGAAGYPYHADGQLCRLFSAEEIMAIAEAATNHKLYHTTLCNHLLTWARRAESVEEIEGITYSAENLPADLAENMANIFAAAAAQL